MRPFYALTVVALSTSLASLYAERGESKYRGFTIDESRVRDLPNLEALKVATQEQIEMVIAVNVPPNLLAFFQGVPFILIPAETIPRGSPGLYGGRDRGVRVTSRLIAVGHKPVLLHELLHAYHEQRITDGFGNRDILNFFKRAKKINAYAPKAHMMQNEREFFACAATTYLYGVTAQEPFRREKVKDSQPELFTYLQKLFGPDAGTYAGSLERSNQEEAE
jgi:hypothetical protein